jgi:hypothetical protein
MGKQWCGPRSACSESMWQIEALNLAVAFPRSSLRCRYSKQGSTTPIEKKNHFAPGALTDLVSETPLCIKHPAISAVPASWKTLAGLEARKEVQRQKAEIEGTQVSECLHWASLFFDRINPPWMRLLIDIFQQAFFASWCPVQGKAPSYALAPLSFRNSYDCVVYICLQEDQ